MEWNVTDTNRLDSFVAAQKNGLSRSKIKKLIKDGLVGVNGNIVTKPAFRLKNRDVVKVSDVASVTSENFEVKPIDLNLGVLFEDDICIVINKPAGISVHPGSGMNQDEKTILNGVAHLFNERGIPFNLEGVLVHRLDKDTTGALIVAKDLESHELLQKQFAKRSVSKQYLAIVYGIPNPPKAKIDAPVGRNLLNRMKMSVFRTGNSREAQTTYSTLDTGENCALLLCDLHTGRTHQIRVHLNYINHPILGDSTYGTHVSDNMSDELNIKSPCLHSWKLKFKSGKKIVEVEAPIPKDFEDALVKARLWLNSI